MTGICRNITAGENGHLLFAGQDTVALAREYGTPLYLMDEDRIRENCRAYQTALEECFGGTACALYASKANSFKAIYRIVQEEKMGIDVVSPGEIYTAQAAGFDLSHAYYHNNNKTDEAIRFAMDAGVGYAVVDNREEVDMLEQEAAKRGIRQKVLLRVTPGIDPHTYEAVATGKVDSKFGIAIETGQAEKLTEYLLKQPHLDFKGFHCHVGSQVFAEDVFEQTAVVMLTYIESIYRRYGYMAEQLDLGGGFGVRYVDTDDYINIPRKIRSLADTIHATCENLSIPVPHIRLEPGRSIVADAGMTLYTVGSVKHITGYKNYVSVDGGMADNPRYALYRSRYTVLSAARLLEEPDMRYDLVGCCCESGDILQPAVQLPETTCRGDIIAVCTTGAYNYSMASNYNRIPRPPIVLLHEGKSSLAVRRETLEDLVRLDV